ncbi:putative F-box protein At3g24700 [Rhododendron vialii]|uniref:putative F-box protein At3g24700 n=1 Tax=Rhododendron vialii TaxID=182163 RepID=UPI00265EF988|nr:putative F-box protein At3g24700 [Rhododendron vialii]
MVIEKLPEALLMEILSRLPVKPLLRSKSVCKGWYSLIQNPSFISLHHNHAASMAVAENTDCLLVKRSLNGGYDGIILSFVPNETPIEDIDVSSLGLDIPGLELLGPCNGVVCLTESGYYSTIVLCNPSMREFRVLPQPSYKKGYVANLGFGFDPSTNDYKVVKFGYYNPHILTDENDETMEIYELSTDSWREGRVNSQIQFGLHFVCLSFASCKGDFYWYMFCPDGDDAIIVFWMTDEVFDAKPLPEVCLFDDSIGSELFVLNDSLALVLYPSEWTEPSSFSVWHCPMEKCFDIWVMEEQGVEVSWTKKFAIGPLQWLEYPLGFRRNGEFLLVSDGVQMMSYNPDTRRIKEYQVYGHSPSRCLQVLLYTESLVSVKRHNERDGHDDLQV